MVDSIAKLQQSQPAKTMALLEVCHTCGLVLAMVPTHENGSGLGLGLDPDRSNYFHFPMI